MRKTSACILCLALLVATAAFAQTGSTSTSTSTTTATKATTKAATCKMHHGEVTGKDATANTLSLHPKKGSDYGPYTVNDTTKYTLNGKKSTWADIANGQMATVSCKMDGTTMVATKVSAKAAPAAAAPAAH